MARPEADDVRPDEWAGKQVHASRRMLDDLRARASGEGGVPDALMDEALESMLTLIEELHVGEEELRVQNEQLIAAQGDVEAERLRYLELFQQAPDAYLVTTPEGAIREANFAASALLNVPPARLRGKPLGVFVVVEARRDFRSRLLQAVQLGRVDDWEVRLRPRRTEEAVDVSCTVTAVHDEGGGVTALRWILRDVSERLRAEESQRALAREEAAHEAAERERGFLEAVIGQMPSGVVIAEATQGRIVRHNAAAEAILGHAPTHGVNLAEYAEGYGALDAEGRPIATLSYPLARSLLDGETVVDEDFRIRRQDGAEAVLRCSSAPVHGPGGTIVAAVLTFTDVTRALEAEETDRFLAEVGEVLSSSLEYRDVVQQVARVCAGTLADYCIVHVREGGGSARALGVAHADPAREEMVRGMLRHFPVDPESPTHPVVQALRTGRPELAADVNDGLLDRMCTGPEHREMLVALGLSSAMVVPIRAKGETLGTISLACTGGSPYDAGDLAVAEEVARRAALAVENARLYQEARQAVRAREEVVAVVSHDLRNPINAVMLAATVLDEFGSGRLDERDRKQVGVIRRSAEQMNALVQDLVEVAAFESGEMPMQRRALVPVVLISAAEEMFVPLAGERGVSLTCQLPDGLPPVSADYGRVLQLFSNLVGNALKFTPAGGSVELGAVQGAGVVRFFVRDTGPGIERDHLPRLFDRFWQAQRGRGAGAGLGLAISRSIVEGHGGQIWAESEPGQGSTFHFTIPVAST